MYDARQEILDRGYADHVFRDRCWSGAEDSEDLPDPFILCGLESADEALLSATCKPDWSSIGEYRHNVGGINLSPMHEVEASYGVTQYGQASDGRSGSIGHDGDMRLPV